MTKAERARREKADRAQQAIELAARWSYKNGSAASCLDDAMVMLGRGEYETALGWAVRSLAHSVGIFGDDYKAAVALRGL